MTKKLLFCLGLILELQVAVGSTEQLVLRGVTVFKPPFVEKDNTTGKLSGFFIDLLDELASAGKFNYTLDNLRTPQNSMLQDNYPSLLVSDVLNNKADFALGDSLFKADNYARYANFTQPYIVSGLSALVQKSLLVRDNITNFEELLEKTKRPRMGNQSPYGSLPAAIDQQAADSKNEGPKSDIQIGTKDSSATYRLLTMSTDPIGREVYERLVQYNENLVDNVLMGVDRANKKPYAFIQEAFNNELELDVNCDLTHLVLKPSVSGSKPIPLLEYSLAVRKRYVHLDMLNDAIKKARDSGKLDEMRQKYWNKKCNAGERSVLSIIVVFLSLTISLFFAC